MKNLERINRKVIDREPMNPILKMKLMNEFLPVVNNLEKIISRDLSNWKR